MTIQRTRPARLILVVAILVVGMTAWSGLKIKQAQGADAFNQNYLMSDAVFDATGTMSASDIQTFLNQFNNSCLKNYTSALPIDYSNYGAPASAAQIIATAANLYGVNPQVILATLEKEQGLVTGASGCASWRYWSAMGYACPDGGALYNYPSLGIKGTCVSSISHAGFSAQVNHGAWQLQFNRQRAIGNLYWRGNQTTPNYGFYTKGTWQSVLGATPVYYDGYATIDGQSVYMTNGVTATLYSYTPHLAGNQAFVNIFTSWFGSTVGTAPSTSAATTTTTTIDPMLSTTNLNAYVNSAYRVFLNRPATADEQTWWTRYIQAGNTRTAFMNTVVQSLEYQRYQVLIDYVLLLHRAADPAGLAAWSNQLAQTNRNDLVLAAVAGSPEYFQNRASSDNLTYVTDLYLDFLGRNMDPGGLIWTSALANGSMTRTQVASTILSSAEYANRLVDQTYLQVLGRHADSAGLAYWAQVYVSTRNIAQLKVALAASPEGVTYLSSLT